MQPVDPTVSATRSAAAAVPRRMLMVRRHTGAGRRIQSRWPARHPAGARPPPAFYFLFAVAIIEQAVEARTSGSSSASAVAARE